MDSILFPKDILLIIASFLSDKDILCSYIRTCSSINKLLDCNQLWHMLCKRPNWISFHELPYKQQYRTCFILMNFIGKYRYGYTLGHLYHIQILDLYFCNASMVLPEEFGHLTKLKQIFLGSNQLDSLPESFNNLSNLQELDLRNNEFQLFPLVLTDLLSLQKLNLVWNQVITLPQEISKLTNLQELHLSNNKLSSLHSSIGELINLKQFHLSHNFLESLPLETSKLTNLTGLWVNSNCIRSFPHYLKNLPLEGKNKQCKI